MTPITLPRPIIHPQEQTPEIGLLEAAIDYQLDGWFPTPLWDWTKPDQRSKKAFLPGWQERSRLTIEECAFHWGNNPIYNVGLVCGHLYDVLDIDGPEGKRGLNEYLGARRYRHAGPVCVTGGGGRHLYFKATGFGSPTHILNKVDFRGKGGQVVAPPSIHPDTGNVYTWLPGNGPDKPLPDAPSFLIDLLRPTVATPRLTTTRSPTDTPLVSATLAAMGVPFKAMRNRYVFKCPTRTHNDSDWSAMTHPTKDPDQWWKCFGCEATGDAGNLLDGSYVWHGRRQKSA